MSRLFDIKQLSFSYPSRPPLFTALDFHVDTGDKVALLGGNGVGKTTLLHLMVGLLTPISGEIVAFGLPRHCENDYFEVRHQAGLLFQDPEDMLFCPTVIEDVAFGPMNLGLKKNEALQVAKEALEQLGMAQYEQRITHLLSGGEKRMITLASVLAMRPRVLLLDEPTNGLDAASKARLLSVLSRLPQAMVLVSHEVDVVDRLANRYFSIERHSA